MSRRPLPSDRFLQHLGPTPLVPVKLAPEQPTIWCKLEFLNPSGSTKDRIARYMLEKAWRHGDISTDSVVVEASSGSTSIALALVCAQMGLRFIAVMPEGVTAERVTTIRAYGGRVVLVPKDGGMKAAMETAESLAHEHKGFATRQFENPDNAEAHRVWTGQEILAQIPGGTVHGVVSGVGTGGTIVGLQAAFAEAGCPTIPFVARPTMGSTPKELECCSFSGRVPGVIDGFSKLFVAADLKTAVTINVSDDVAMQTARALHRRGFPVGPSSGLNFAAAIEAHKTLANVGDGPHEGVSAAAGAHVVTVFPDRMERYFSSGLIEPG